MSQVTVVDAPDLSTKRQAFVLREERVASICASPLPIVCALIFSCFLGGSFFFARSVAYFILAATLATCSCFFSLSLVSRARCFSWRSFSRLTLRSERSR